MPTTFDAAFEKVSELVHLFAEHEAEYLLPKYQESEVRTDFIDKFFIALGWDVHHRQQTNPREQEVKVEKNPDSNSSGRRADYAFHIKPDYKTFVFFAEAKKPSRDLGNTEDYFQLVRYGNSAKTPIGVLTSFAEFHIIDCRYQAHTAKSYPSAQIKIFTYKEYLDREKFADIYWLFSREAVEAGKLKEFAGAQPKQRGKGAAKLTQEEARPTDDKFLDDLEEYRRKLAKAFKKSDETLDAEALTEATQKVIDRLVFIRFLEDRNIESDYIVDQIAAKKGGAWKSFIGWSKELDVKYNGVVFKPHEVDKPSFSPPDEKVFQEICSEISHHNSKYLFSYIPVELLGSIYERFLGKVVTATAKRADIEYKPEVRKAGGVYYTPKYIVDYIVANTVGKILKGTARPELPHLGTRRGLGGGQTASIETPPPTPPRTEVGQDAKGMGLAPKEVSKLRFADIACGSGSFLIAVYDTVLHHVESWYNEHPDEAKKAGCITLDKGVYALSLKQKQQILLDNIYGVDIDPQAVEVAQLSLFLKFLESESGAGASQLTFERTKILPDLSKNIVCGNSLVEYDIADLFPLTDAEEKRIKPFSFQSAFKEVMQRGGFDAIVGNPPFVSYYGGDAMELSDGMRLYYSKNYDVVRKVNDRINSFCLFIERASKTVKPDGRTGYIVNKTLLELPSYQSTREYLIKKTLLDQIITFNLNVFKVVVDTCVLIYRPSTLVEGNFTNVFWDCNSEEALTAVNSEPILQSSFLENRYSELVQVRESSLFRKMEAVSVLADKIVVVNRGMNIGGRAEYFLSNNKKSDYFHRYLLKSPNVSRYSLHWSPDEENCYVLFDTELEKDLKRKGATIALGQEARFNQEKLLINEASQVLTATYDDTNFYASYSFHVATLLDSRYSLKYVLALFNSRLLSYYAIGKNILRKGKLATPHLGTKGVSALPLRSIDFSNLNDETRHTALVALVDQMLDTKKRIATAQRDSDRERLQLKCDYLDGEIDRLVYGLYGLTAEEIGIVEGS